MNRAALRSNRHCTSFLYVHFDGLAVVQKRCVVHADPRNSVMINLM
jgi:hypothetical protein